MARKTRRGGSWAPSPTTIRIAALMGSAAFLMATLSKLWPL